MFSELMKEHFWSKVNISHPDECWEWQGTIATTGYGVLTIRQKETSQKQFRTHRLAYQFYHNVNPGKMCVCHSCDNKKCCNPSHLWLGTSADNNHDRKSKSGYNVGSQNYLSVLNEEQVFEIVQLLQESKLTTYEIAARYSVNRATVTSIRMGKCWTHVTGGKIINHKRPSEKLNPDKVLEIRKMLNDGIPQKEIASKFGVVDSLISMINRGKIWGWVK